MSPEQYRAICFNSHGRECEFCGDTETVIVHHRDGDRSHNTPENLLPVCPTHHMNIHQRSAGFGDWHDELLPPSQRTLTSKDEYYIRIDEFTDKVVREMKEIHDISYRMAVRSGFKDCLRGRVEMRREEFEVTHTEVLLKDTGREQLAEIVDAYDFDDEPDALKSAVISWWRGERR